MDIEKLQEVIYRSYLSLRNMRILLNYQDKDAASVI